MDYFHLERGRIVDIPIDFVWYIADKLDLLDEAGGGTFKIKRIRDNLFEGRFKVINGTIELVSVDSVNKNVKFLANVGGLGCYISAIWTFELAPILDGKTSAFSYVDLKPQGFTKLVFRFLESTFQEIADEMANTLVRGAINLYEDPEEYGIPYEVIERFYRSRKGIPGAVDELIREDLSILEITKSDGSYIIEYTEKDRIKPYKSKPIITFKNSNRNVILKMLNNITNQLNSFMRIRGVETKYRNKKGKQILDDLEDLGSFMFNLLLPTNYAKQIRGSRDKHILLETNDIEMPWELMHDGKNFLCLKHHIGRSLVTESLEPIRNSTEFESQPTDKKDVEIAIIVDPSEDLPATKVERTLADKLEGFGKVDVFEGRDFTSVKAIKVFGRESYDIIHYAGHARFDKDNPFNSSLKLYDGKISAEDIAKAVSKNTYKPHLLFINACTSARHIDHKQEIEYVGHKSVGLASLLLRYGIQAYVGALWNIYDESAANFALEFYKRVLENQTFGSAMTDARRLTFTESKGRDLTWSSFVLYGNPITKLSQK